MRPILIFGAGQTAEVMHGYLRRNSIGVAAHVVDVAHWRAGTWIGDSPVVAFEQAGVVTFTPAGDYDFFIGMSFKGMNKPRADKYQAMLDRGYGPSRFVHPMCARNGRVGAGSFVMDLNVMMDGTEIGENCILFPHNHVGHHTKIGNHVFIASHAVIGGACEIGDYSFIGVNATIRDNVKIGKECLIGAGALVLTDVPDGTVIQPKESERSKVPSSRVRW